LDSAETLAEMPPEVLWVSNDTAFEGFEAMPAEGILLRMRGVRPRIDVTELVW